MPALLAAAGPFRRFGIREKLLVLIIVPLGVLLLLVGVVTKVSSDTRAAATALHRSTGALQSAQDLLVTLVDAETGMRGYVLTGDRRFTEPYRAAVVSFSSRIARFDDAARDGSNLRSQARSVVLSAIRSFSLVTRYVQLVDEGKGARARAEVAAGLGKKRMDRFRAAVATYERAEHRLDDATSNALAAAWDAMRALLVAGALFAAATSFLLYVTISRGIIVRLRGLQNNLDALAVGATLEASKVRNDEIARVERSFRDMVRLLSEREDALVRANSLHRAIVQGADHAIITTDVHGVITSFNPSAERMLGFTALEVVGRHTPARFHLVEELIERAASVGKEVGRDVDPGFDVLVASVQPERSERHEWTYVRADATRLPICATVTPLCDEACNIVGYVGVSEDITQRKAVEQAIIKSELEQREYASQLHALHLISNTIASAQKDPIDRSLQLGLEQLGLDSAYVAVIDEERAGLVVERCVSASKSTSRPLVAAGDCIPNELAFLGNSPRASEVYSSDDVTMLRGLRTNAGTFNESGAYIAAPIYVRGALYGAIGFLGAETRKDQFSAVNRDFVRVGADLIGTAIERRQESTRLDNLAFFDALTDLPNRVLLLDRLNQTVLAAKRYGETFALLYLDLDGFKAVNDAFGHGVGDEVLKAASRRFEKLLRTSDTVARLGGDEFVILAPKLANALDAGDLASRVVESMRRPIVVGGVKHALGVSVGIGVYPHDGADAGSLIDSADRALYRAKAKGKNRFIFASDFALATLQAANRERVPPGA